MHELSTLLQRAAATPTGGPIVSASRRTGPVVGTAAGLVVVAVIVVIAWSLANPSGPGSSPVATPRSRIERAGVAIGLPEGWWQSDGPTAPWLASPHEVLAVATAPVTPITAPGNHAACASEIPTVGVDAARRSGAFVWIGELGPGATYAPPPTRPASFATAEWHALCALPGLETRGTTFTEKGRDFVVSVVIGRTASTGTRREIDSLLDSLTLPSR